MIIDRRIREERRYNICPLANQRCSSARHSNKFYRFCFANYKDCRRYIEKFRDEFEENIERRGL